MTVDAGARDIEKGPLPRALLILAGVDLWVEPATGRQWSRRRRTARSTGTERVPAAAATSRSRRPAVGEAWASLVPSVDVGGGVAVSRSLPSAFRAGGPARRRRRRTRRSGRRYGCRPACRRAPRRSTRRRWRSSRSAGLPPAPGGASAGGGGTAVVGLGRQRAVGRGDHLFQL